MYTKTGKVLHVCAGIFCSASTHSPMLLITEQHWSCPTAGFHVKNQRHLPMEMELLQHLHKTCSLQ